MKTVIRIALMIGVLAGIQFSRGTSLTACDNDRNDGRSECSLLPSQAELKDALDAGPERRRQRRVQPRHVGHDRQS